MNEQEIHEKVWRDPPTPNELELMEAAIASDDPNLMRRWLRQSIEIFNVQAQYEEDPEPVAVLAALVYFAPTFDVTVVPFQRAFLRACELLQEHAPDLSPDDLREWVEKWPDPKQEGDDDE